MTYGEVGLVCYLTLSWGIVFRLGLFRGAGGKYTKRYHAGTNLVLLHPDVRKAHRSDGAVNEDLLLVIELPKVGSDKRKDYSSNGGSGPMTQFEVRIFNLFQRLMRTGW